MQRHLLKESNLDSEKHLYKTSKNKKIIIKQLSTFSNKCINQEYL